MTSGGLFTQKIKQIFSVSIESGKVLFRMATPDLDGNTELHWHAYKGDLEGINLALKRVPEYLNEILSNVVYGRQRILDFCD
jgi:hypothetical protein